MTCQLGNALYYKFNEIKNYELLCAYVFMYPCIQ